MLIWVLFFVQIQSGEDPLPKRRNCANNKTKVKGKNAKHEKNANRVFSQKNDTNNHNFTKQRGSFGKQSDKPDKEPRSTSDVQAQKGFRVV